MNHLARECWREQYHMEDECEDSHSINLACDEAMGGEIHASLAQSLNQELQKFPVNSKLQVQLGDHVVVKGERTGRIRYIGHLDKIVGRHDGFFNGKRYFFCHKDHGIFLPLHDIVCKVQPKVNDKQ
nr:hypothetical protein BaRGS_024517 [Batillaria attramentaria]